MITVRPFVDRLGLLFKFQAWFNSGFGFSRRWVQTMMQYCRIVLNEAVA
jgi:hypothetical protein